jgi:hypothetical protein
MNMNRKILAILVGVVAIGVAAAGAYYFGYDHGYERSVDSTRNTNQPFKAEGLLLRNQDGLKPDTWYLSYEIQGQAYKTEMAIPESIPVYYSIGQRVAVEGTIDPLHEKITVTSLSDAKVTEPGDTQEPFHESGVYGFYGTITLTGYLDVQKRVCNPGDMCGDTVDYASFVFTSGANDALRKFTGQMQGNSFVAGDRVGIGCLLSAQSRIRYENDADIGWKAGDITGSDYQKLVASSKTSPIQLKMTREIYTSGRGAPDCYSHFRNFDVL